ncbi:MAG: hypothetical protein FJ286_12030 [Planctomycetes bacterium]|nr:hypothetical protein [Planctomycetota bacterium]
MSENLESWLARREAAERPVPGYVEEEFRGYLECGILCFGFARARCTGCGQGFVVAARLSRARQPWEPLAFPSAAWQDGAMDGPPCLWLAPPVPVRQWVISVPKRLRGFLADRPTAVAALTRIFLDEIERTLIMASGGTADADTPSASRPRLGGISFLHRFSSVINHHVHLHACVTDGVFRPAAVDGGLDSPPAFLACPFRAPTPTSKRCSGGSCTTFATSISMMPLAAAI